PCCRSRPPCGPGWLCGRAPPPWGGGSSDHPDLLDRRAHRWHHVVDHRHPRRPRDRPRPPGRHRPHHVRRADRDLPVRDQRSAAHRRLRGWPVSTTPDLVRGYGAALLALVLLMTLAATLVRLAALALTVPALALDASAAALARATLTLTTAEETR